MRRRTLMHHHHQHHHHHRHNQQQQQHQPHWHSQHATNTATTTTVYNHHHHNQQQQQQPQSTSQSASSPPPSASQHQPPPAASATSSASASAAAAPATSQSATSAATLSSVSYPPPRHRIATTATSSRSSSSSSSSTSSSSTSSTASSSSSSSYVGCCRSSALSRRRRAAAAGGGGGFSGGAVAKDEDTGDTGLVANGLVALTAMLCYVNSLPGQFVHDDYRAVVENRDVLGKTQWWQVFRNDYWGDAMSEVFSHKSYRPITIWTFRLDHALFGLNASWFHATNVLLHSIACVLFTRVCRRMAGLRRNFATLAGVLFAVHPIHTEAVSGIVGRADVLACVFFLISLLAYHGKSSNPSRRALMLSVAAAGLSLLAKETGVTVLGVNVLLDVYRSWPTLRKCGSDVRWPPVTAAAAAKNRWQMGGRLLTLAVAGAVILGARMAMLQGSVPRFSASDNPAACQESVLVRSLTFWYLAAFNCWLMLCPSMLAHDWSYKSIPLVTSPLDPRNAITLFALVALLAILWQSLRNLHKSARLQQPALILGPLLLIVPFLPASNLLFTVGFVVAERVLYMPSMGLVILATSGAQSVWHFRPQWRRLIGVASAVLLLAGACRTVRRNPDWHSKQKLSMSGLAELPHNAKFHYNIGNYMREVHELKIASAHFREALRLWPEYPSAHNNLGSMMCDIDEAEHHFRLAIRYDPRHVNAHFNMGRVHKTKNRTAEAIREFELCLQLSPAHVPSYKQLIELRRGAQVGRLHREVLQLKPADQSRRAHYGLWLLEKRAVSSAMRQFEMSMQIEKTHLTTFVGICRTLRLLGQRARLQKFVERWSLMRRIHESSSSDESAIYLRDLSIKYELRNRAMIYDYKTKSPVKASEPTSATTPLTPTASTISPPTTKTTVPSTRMHRHHLAAAPRPSAPALHRQPQQPGVDRRRRTEKTAPTTVTTSSSSQVPRIDHRVRQPPCNVSATKSLLRATTTSHQLQPVRHSEPGSQPTRRPRQQQQQQQHEQQQQMQHQQQQNYSRTGDDAGRANCAATGEACNPKRWTKSRHKYGPTGAGAGAADDGAASRDRGGGDCRAAAMEHNVAASLSFVSNIMDTL